MNTPESNTRLFHEFELQAWEGNASLYDKYVSQVTRFFVGPLLSAAQVGAGDVLLDLATGPGYAASAASQIGATAIGIDFAANMIAEARKFYPETRFEQGDATALAFEDNAFDAVTINFGMLHFAESDKVLGEARRVLKPGGRLAFTVWADPHGEAAIFGLLMNTIEEFGTLDVGLPPGPSVFRFSDHEESGKSLQDSGFDNIHVVDVAHGWAMPYPDALFDLFHEGGARIGKVLRAQKPSISIAIRNAIRERSQRMATNGTVPMGATLSSARKSDGRV